MSIKRYLQESFQDFHLVTWPTRKRAIRITIIVFIFTGVAAALLGFVDQLLSLLYQLFL